MPNSVGEKYDANSHQNEKKGGGGEKARKRRGDHENAVISIKNISYDQERRKEKWVTQNNSRSLLLYSWAFRLQSFNPFIVFVSSRQ